MEVDDDDEESAYVCTINIGIDEEHDKVDWSQRLTKLNITDWYNGVLSGEFSNQS